VRPAHNVSLRPVCSARPQRHPDRVHLGQLEYLRRVRDSRCAPLSPALVNHAPALLQGCAPLPGQVKSGPALRCVQVGRPAQVDRPRDLRNGREVADAPDRLPLAASAPVQRVRQGFQKLSPASPFMRASLPQGADARSSRSDLQKVSASCILCARARA
jgi:hypothetical protein